MASFHLLITWSPHNIFVVSAESGFNSAWSSDILEQWAIGKFIAEHPLYVGVDIVRLPEGKTEKDFARSPSHVKRIVLVCKIQPDRFRVVLLGLQSGKSKSGEGEDWMKVLGGLIYGAKEDFGITISYSQDERTQRYLGNIK